MKKKYSLGGIILKDGNSVEFKTGDWKNKYPYHDKEKCKNCFAKFYCSGGCMANSYNFHGTIHDTYEIGCEMQRKRVECAIMMKAALAEE